VLACAVLGTSGCGKGGSSGSADALAPTGPLSDRVAALVEPLIEDGWAHGLMVGVVQNGRESYFPFGSLNDEANPSIDKNTVFEIGSITKVFTALALADMAVKEELSIDDAAEKWLPDEWNVATTSGEPITLKGLAAHISGLPVVPANFWNDGDNTFDGDLGGRRWAEYPKPSCRTTSQIRSRPWESPASTSTATLAQACWDTFCPRRPASPWIP